MISNLIFFIAGCFLFLKLNVILLIFIASSVVLNALFVLKVVQSNSLRYSYINQKILVETKQYLNISSNMMFFGGFLVILTSFIQGYDNNALIAVISLILLRKVVANLSNAITIAKKLANNQLLNNALIFSSIPYVQSKVTFKGNSLLSLHNRSKRYSDVVLLFNQIKPNYKVLSVNWQDVTLHGIKILVVTTQAADGKNHIYLQQMIPPNLTNELSNEATLLNFIPREKLQMAETVHFFNLDIYSCRILDGGEKLGLDKILWPKVQRQLLTDIWSIKLPKELINIYQQTHQLLFKRLTSEVCDILNVAIDTQKEADLLAKFIAELPVLRKIISTHPLVLFNPDINMTNVLKEEQRYKVIFWGRWQLEPLGVALMRSGQHKDQFSSYIKKIAMRRKDTAGRLWKNDLELGALAFQWETYVKQEKYKQALLTMKKILNAIDTIVIKS